MNSDAIASARRDPLPSSLHFRHLWLAVTVSVIASFHGLVAAESGPERTVLTDPNVVWQMTPDERGQVHPLRVEGYVNYVDLGWGLLWMESASGGGFFMQLGQPRPLLRSGQHVRIEGTFIPTRGLCGDTVTISVLPEKALPPPLPTTGRIGEIRSFDRQRVVTEAYVDTQQFIDNEHLRLSLIVDERPVICWVPPDNPAALRQWQGLYVRVRALYSGRLDPTGTQATVELWVARESDIEVVGTIANAPEFNRPQTLISDLGSVPAGTLVRVRGALQRRDIGTTAVLRDRSGEVIVHSLQKQQFTRESTIEAVGRTAIVGSQWIVESALMRNVPANTPAVSTTAANSPAAPLRMISEIRRLNPQDYTSGKAVAISGVVTWSLPEYDFFFLQDVSGGIRVRFPRDQMSAPPLQKWISVEGVTYNGGLAPAVELRSTGDLGAMSHPQPQKVTLDQVATGSADGQWVELRGFVRETVSEGDWRWTYITTPAGEFVAHLWSPVTFVANPGSLVRVRGVCETQVDEKGRLVGIKLRVPYLHDYTIEEDAPADLFDVPLRPLNSLAQLNNLQDMTRVRVIAEVVHQVPGQSLTLHEGDTGLRAFTRLTESLQPGDVVEAVGILGLEGARTVLRETTYRKHSHHPPPAPVTIADPSRVNTMLDERLVRIRGTLIGSLQAGNRTRLTLQSGTTLYEALLDSPAAAPPPTGAGLELTGLYRIDFDDARRTRGFTIQLRDNSDIVMRESPRLWTVTRALVVAGILAACALLGVIWATLLRRRVRQQTEQIRAQLEKELVLEERHRSIIENASDFIFTTDLHGRFTSFNPAGSRMTGFAREHALLLNIRDMLAPEDEGAKLLKPELLPANDGTVTFQSRLRAADGHLIWSETSARLIREHGQPVGVLGIMRDISDRKHIEEELKRARDAAEATTRAKSEFLANMSHEIRTPMNAVIGMTNLLLDTSLESHQRDFAESIRQGAEALLTVLNDILDFSKIEAGKLQFEMLDFDLQETLDSTVELLAARAAAKQLDLSAFIPVTLPVLLRGDPGRLRQVLFNLIGNAIKFTTRGEVTARVALETENTQHVTLRFEVTDTGIGLSEEEQARLFRPFSQADGSTTRRFGGTGLGLAITRQIVSLMHGACGVRSKPGHGSTFWFTARFDRQAGAGRPALEASASVLAGQRVLVVDDAPSSRGVIAAYLAGWNACVTETSNAGEALNVLRAAALKGEPFQVALVDAHLSCMDGAGFVGLAHGDPALRGLRIVLMTAVDRQLAPEARATLGVDGWLVRPVTPRDLRSVLTAAVQPATAVETSATLTPGKVPQTDGMCAPTLGAPLRVLVAEDNIVNQRVALLMLKKLGHKPQAVANGLEVLAALERAEYDVILMDCQMPELDGYETTTRIRQENPQRGIWIVALTANAMTGDRERCLAAGMNDYLSKPMRESELAAALGRAQVDRQAAGPGAREPSRNHSGVENLKTNGSRGRDASSCDSPKAAS